MGCCPGVEKSEFGGKDQSPLRRGCRVTPRFESQEKSTSSAIPSVGPVLEPEKESGKGRCPIPPDTCRDRVEKNRADLKRRQNECLATILACVLIEQQDSHLITATDTAAGQDNKHGIAENSCSEDHFTPE
jgi:hypothetical protein